MLNCIHTHSCYIHTAIGHYYLSILRIGQLSSFLKLSIRLLIIITPIVTNITIINWTNLRSPNSLCDVSQLEKLYSNYLKSLTQDDSR